MNYNKLKQEVKDLDQRSDEIDKEVERVFWLRPRKWIKEI